MKLHKRILRNDTVREAVCRAAAAYMRLVQATTRWTRSGDDIVRDLVARGRPVVLCYWHGRLLMLGPGWPYPERTHLVISQHRDGRIIAGTIARFGFRTIAGSTTRGGAAALRGMVRALAEGDMVGITPDGPHGPRMRVGAGAVAVARLSGAALLPIAYSVTRRRIVPSWDRFVVPLPFGRGAYLIGEPITVDRDADAATQEAARIELERRLNDLTAEADRLCRQTRIEPAPAEAAP